jgi:hypothetical protein
MDPNIIHKILSNSFPEEIVREIASYFILKIPKTDKRITWLDLLLRERNRRIREGFYKEGQFFHHIFVCRKHVSEIYIALHFWPNKYAMIKHIFGNLKTKEQIVSRFRIEEGKHEEYVNGSWVEKHSI